MDQNLTVLYSQSGERYCPGAPLLIVDSAVLRSEISGELFGRVKFRNMDERVVQVVQYRVQPLDAANRPLGSPFVQRQMDLSAAWEMEFGSELLFLLPDPFTRGLKLEIVEVIFADASLWEAPEEANWEPIPAPQPLLKTLGDPELLDLLQQEKGQRCWALPARYEGFWRCSCGHLTEDRFSCCPKCGQSYFEPDVAALTAVRDQRLQEAQEAKAKADAYAAEQARIAAEQKAAARKKAKKVRRILLLTILPALLIAAIVLLGIPGFYTLQAQSAAKSGDYVTAVEKYESAARFGLFDRLFQVSGEQARLTPAAHYQRGEEALAAGDFDGALAAFTEAGTYSDAAARILETHYRQAEEALSVGDSVQAAEAFRAAGDYSDAAQRRAELYYQLGKDSLAAGDKAQAVRFFRAAGEYRDANRQILSIMQQEIDTPQHPAATIAAGNFHSVAIKEDGIVVSVGSNSNGECNVSGWRNIVSVSAGHSHTVGLRNDGVVLATGLNDDGQCDVSELQDIVSISAGAYFTVALRIDGTVAAVGSNSDGQCNVEDWQDIVAIAAGSRHTLGLKSDGTVVAVGDDSYGQCQVQDWSGIVAIAAGNKHSVGLKADGTVVAVGDDLAYPRISYWTDIVAISAGSKYTVGLRADGTVVASGNGNYGEASTGLWSNIVAIAAGYTHTLGLQADGSVVAVGRTDYRQCDVFDWHFIKTPD